MEERADRREAGSGSQASRDRQGVRGTRSRVLMETLRPAVNVFKLFTAIKQGGVKTTTKTDRIGRRTAKGVVHVGKDRKDCQLNTTIDVGLEICKKEKRNNKRTRERGKKKINERLITHSSLPHRIIETEQDGVDELHKMSTTRRQHSLGGDGKEATGRKWCFWLFQRGAVILR